MNKEAIDEYYKVLDETVKEFAEEKFVKNGGFEIADLFDYKSVDFTDMYKPIVLRSTNKEEPHKFTPNEKIKNLAYTEDFENMLISAELYGISKDDYKSSISSEMREFMLVKALHFQDLYWNNSYKYENEVNNETSNLDLDESYQYYEEVRDGLMAFLKLEFNFHGNDRFQLEPRQDETGYLVPEYPLLKMQLDYVSIEETRNSIVKDFKLEKDANLITVSELGAFRDLLEKQIQRQIVQIDNLNEQIRKILIYYYRILEVSILKVNNKKRLEEKKKKAPKDWFFCLIMFKNVYDTFFMNFTEDRLIEFHCYEFKRNPYLNKEIKESLIDTIKSSYQKKKPIITVAREIALKLRVTEALIEGIIMDGSLKNVEDIVEDLIYADLPSPSKIASDFVKRPGYKNPTYDEDIIEHVMRKTRNYIIEKNITNMYGKVSTVAKKIEDSEAGIGARITYVRFYSIAAKRYNRPKKEEASKEDDTASTKKREK